MKVWKKIVAALAVILSVGAAVLPFDEPTIEAMLVWLAGASAGYGVVTNWLMDAVPFLANLSFETKRLVSVVVIPAILAGIAYALALGAGLQEVPGSWQGIVYGVVGFAIVAVGQMLHAHDKARDL